MNQETTTPREKRVLRFCAWIFLIDAAFLATAAFTDVLPKHAFDASWSAHARFHVSMSAAHMLALGVLVGLIAWFPFQEARRWSWWGLAVFTVLGFGSIPLSAAWQGSGPPVVPYTLIVLAILAGLLALALSWKPVFHARTSAFDAASKSAA